MNRNNVFKFAILIIGFAVGVMLANNSYDVLTTMSETDKRNTKIIGSLGLVISVLMLLIQVYDMHKSKEAGVINWDGWLLVCATVIVAVSSSVLLSSLDFDDDSKVGVSSRCAWMGLVQVLLFAVYLGSGSKNTKKMSAVIQHR